MKDRQSNIEQLRIIAMLLVVFVHANYFSLGTVSQSEILRDPYTSLIRIFLEQICIVGVNVFVLISGWFGIRPTLRGGQILYSKFYFILF